MARKRKGTIMDILPALLGIVASAIVMMAFLNIIKIVSVKEDVKELVRHYLLEMETVGYLSVSSQTELTQKLTELQATDIDLTGTTYTNAGYGNPIYISVKCTIHTDMMSGEENGLLSIVFQDTGFPVAIRKMSTAKN